MITSTLPHSWTFTHTGVADAETNMAVDRAALDEAARPGFSPRARFFGWVIPAVSYGYLLNRDEVEAWARERGRPPVVQRPTGGGVVLHSRDEVSLSLVWPRGQKLLPESPRDCYAAIHHALRDGLSTYLKGQPLDLFSKTASACETADAPSSHFSACFSAPVCNDVMQADRKVIGGALRLTKSATMYQGTVNLSGAVDRSLLSAALENALRRLLPGDR